MAYAIGKIFRCLNILWAVILLQQDCVHSYSETVILYKGMQNVADITGSKYYPSSGNISQEFYRILCIDSKHGDGGHILVGGRNSLTELDQEELSLVNKVKVPIEVDEEESFSCEILKKANEAYYCHNYITFMQEVNETTWILCGTNALFPRCFVYSNNELKNNWVAKGITASGPDQVTATFAIQQGEDLVVYSGAPTRRELEYAISRTVVGPDGVQKSVVRTDTDSPDWIESNSVPSFIGQPIEYNGKMYFFFREEAVEAKNVEKVVYSRVAQVCMNDTGGTSGNLMNKWTTFLKARLSCATQGNFKMYFNNLQSIYRSRDNSNIVFGVFTTPSSGIPASALCAYDLAEVEQLFTVASFKNQANRNSLWLPVPADDVPTPRPGTCTTSQPSENYDRVSSILLMLPLIPNKADYASPRSWTNDVPSDSPILILQGHRSLQLVVLEKSASGLAYDFYFFATDKGRILKAYIYEGEPRIVDDMSLHIDGMDQEPVNAMQLGSNGTTIFASTHSRVYRLPTENCERFQTCKDCVLGRDPACSWVSEGESRCKQTQTGLRDLTRGDTSACPVASSTTTSQTIPATPASESTVAPMAASTQPVTSKTTSTQRTGQPVIGTSTTASMGSSPSPSTTTPTPSRGLTIATTPTTLDSSELPPTNISSLLPVTGSNGELVRKQTSPNSCVPWIAVSVVLICFCNIPSCIALFFHCKRRKKFTPKKIPRGRHASQKVPLHPQQDQVGMSDNEDDDSTPDEMRSLRVSEKNGNPHTEIVMSDSKNNGMTTPVKDATMSASEV